MSDFDATPLTPSAGWPDVPELSTAAKALGGAGGAMNAQALALAARTLQLKAATDSLQAGAALLHGTTAPDNANGKDGDVYIDTAAGNLYTKASGAWGAATSLVGPAGAGNGLPRTLVFGGPTNGSATSVTTTWTVPLNVNAIRVRMWGGGASGSTVAGGIGGGGGSAAHVLANFSVTPGEVLTLTVGNGGQATNANNGNPGNDSSVTSSSRGLLCTAGGGHAPSGAAGGDYGMPATPNAGAHGYYGCPGAPASAGGFGAGAPFGGPATFIGGNAGCTPGGGGAGSSATNQGGGMGGQGLIVIEY